MLANTNPSRKGLRFLKRVMYSQMALRDGVLILFGKAQPRHVLQYDGELDLVLSPWFNI